MCLHCPRTYYPSHLRDHVKSIHEKTKDHVCDLCGAAYGRKSHLKDHINVVHNDIKPFACDQCSYRCTRRYLLKDHIKGRARQSLSHCHSQATHV